MASNSSSNNGKKQCPFMEKCYRRNPIHFKEMSHPHLEKIAASQLEKKVQVPDNLDFECSDRSLLMDQLNILQLVLRREKDNSTCSSTSTTGMGSDVSIIYSTIPKGDSSGGQNLKDKVERHKQIMTERRESKLKGMDDQAEALSKSSTSKVHVMRQELDSLKIEEERTKEDDSPQGIKRNNNLKDNEPVNKKSKSNNSDYHGDIKESTQSTDKSSNSEQSSSSSNSKSLFNAFQSCKTAKSRLEFREKAISMMKQRGFEVSVVEPGKFDLKYACSAPYHIFFTRIQKSKATYHQQFSITFPEILDRSLGEIECSLQISYMVDVGWLCLQYLLAGQRPDMFVIYGERVDTENVGSNITLIPIQMQSKFGCHHTKLMILKYKNDGIRIVVSTANLYVDDWDNRTQGVWISPHLPPLPESANTGDGESPTGFKKDLERYLNKYKEPIITEWLVAIRRADFSSINVFFVASVPGSQRASEQNFWGHKKLASVLSAHATLPADAPQWPIVAQSSSIGSLGPNFDSWLLKDIVPAMSRETTSGLKSHPKFHFIYPSINNYKQSFDCQVGSCCFPYGLQTHSKQEWIESYLYQWKSTHIGRDKAMPHIKSYTRFSPDFKKVPWFLLTSANLSKAAWGVAKNSFIMNFEAGVLFIPKFITGSTTFPIQEEEAGVPVFPIPYDIPLTKYERQDKPFVVDIFSGSD
ncbi:probable tyrosyl-DNA phosphodiesterase [Colletes gigas]|uniref:probable tyrosyl-DNA phosphodiesterase n=1 Tax=Colletes gigas TaxID=935657 RepID=UPI001C9B56F7|nr:probable tyrosyl-DNA phosphodiesterase [Colletes gigas]